MNDPPVPDPSILPEISQRLAELEKRVELKVAGQTESQGDWSMNARPVPLNMLPQAGYGGGTP